jgi:hypothetical protein
MVKVHNSKGRANRTGPESCVAHREMRDEALTGESAGPPTATQCWPTSATIASWALSEDHEGIGLLSALSPLENTTLLLKCIDRVVFEKSVSSNAPRVYCAFSSSIRPLQSSMKVSERPNPVAPPELRPDLSSQFWGLQSCRSHSRIGTCEKSCESLRTFVGIIRNSLLASGVTIVMPSATTAGSPLVDVGWICG